MFSYNYHFTFTVQPDLEEKMYLVRPDNENQWSRSSSPKVHAAEAAVLEPLPLSDDSRGLLID